MDAEKTLATPSPFTAMGRSRVAGPPRGAGFTSSCIPKTKPSKSGTLLPPGYNAAFLFLLQLIHRAVTFASPLPFTPLSQCFRTPLWAKR